MLLDPDGPPRSGPPIALLRDLPRSAELLALGREWLLAELLPLVPEERHRELRLVATAMAIAEREAASRAAPAPEAVDKLARLAADLRAGAFEACEEGAQAARAILWRLTMIKLGEGNPAFLAENGFGA